MDEQQHEHLNKDKTELIVFSSKQHVKKAANHLANVGSSYIMFSILVRYLGLILDNTGSRRLTTYATCEYSTLAYADLRLEGHNQLRS